MAVLFSSSSSSEESRGSLPDEAEGIGAFASTWPCGRSLPSPDDIMIWSDSLPLSSYSSALLIVPTLGVRVMFRWVGALGRRFRRLLIRGSS